MREAFAEAAKAYEAQNPNVRVELIAVPIRSWPAWLRTQLTGETAPDVLGLLGVSEEMLLRFFEPLGAALDEPNPHNRGTPLDGLAWRETFVGGLEMYPVYSVATDEVYGVMLQLNSLRLFYNRDLLRETTGRDQPPTTFGELREFAQQVHEWSQRSGRRVAPIAGCLPYGEHLFHQVGLQLTQRLAVDRSPLRSMQLNQADLAMAIMRGDLQFEDPAIQSSYALMREMGTMMQPGFMQLQRDDALFAFYQGGAVMIYTGSWDYAGLVQQSPFQVGAARLPSPGPEDPRYGAFTLGPVSEASLQPEAHFGVTRFSKHPEVARDFLRFLSSYPMAERFAAMTLRMPAIAEVPPPPDLQSVAPQLEGMVPGVATTFRELPGGNARHLVQREYHALLSRDGSHEEFGKRVAASLKPALRRDLDRLAAGIERESRDNDARLGLLLSRPGGADLSGAQTIWTVQHPRETQAGQIRGLLAQP
jgi:ABC-type glycerol-3-phosphate transport system substrate-binding protein